MMKMHFTICRTSGLWLAVLVVAAVGCGSGEKATGRISGTVTYNGKPVGGGTVNLLSKSGVAAQAVIVDGAYEIDAPLDVGDYAVYVSPPRPEPKPPGSPPSAPLRFDVPVKFQDAVTSGVTVTVAAGKNDMPIKLAD